MSAQAESKNRIPLDAAWRKVIGRLLDKQDVVGKQLKAARKDYPELIAAFQLLLGWQGFLARRRATEWASTALAGGVGYTPYPPGPEQFGQIPDEICQLAPTLCNCFNDGDRDSCIELAEDDSGDEIVAGVGEIFERTRTCADIRADYCNALDCAKRFCEQRAVSNTQLEEWTQCQHDIARHWNELFESGCVRVWVYVDIARRLAERRFARAAP